MHDTQFPPRARRPKCEILTLISRTFLLFLLFLAVPVASSAQERWTALSQTTSPAFIISQNDKGETTCSEVTSKDHRLTIDRLTAGPTRVIYSGAPRYKDLPAGTQMWNSPEAGLPLQPSAGLRIVLHGTTQLEQNQTAKAAFIVAANRWESIISTPITVVIDVDFGPTFFGQPYPDPSILGATGLSALLGPYSDLRQRLIDGASSAAEQQIYNALPQSAVPVEFN